MDEFVIKPLAVEEIADVAALFALQMAEHAVHRSHEELAAGLRTVLAEPQQGFVLSAAVPGGHAEVVYATRIFSLEHGGWSGWLEELFVRPDWRGRGVGSALLAAAIEGAKERGWAALDLEVDANHQRAIPLYDRNRFQAVPRARFVRRLRAQ